MLDGWAQMRTHVFFIKTGSNPASFYLFSFFFSHCNDKCSTNLTINDKSMLGSRTPGDRMESADESTELWRHPELTLLWSVGDSVTILGCFRKFKSSPNTFMVTFGTFECITLYEKILCLLFGQRWKKLGLLWFHHQVTLVGELGTMQCNEYLTRTNLHLQAL